MITPVPGVVTVSDEVVDEPATSGGLSGWCDGGELADPASFDDESSNPVDSGDPDVDGAEDSAESELDDVAELVEADETVSSADATPGVVARAPPTPSATARAPTRPTYLPYAVVAWDFDFPSADPAIAVCCICASTDIVPPSLVLQTAAPAATRRRHGHTVAHSYQRVMDCYTCH